MIIWQLDCLSLKYCSLDIKSINQSTYNFHRLTYKMIVLWQVCFFSLVLWFSPFNKSDFHNVTYVVLTPPIKTKLEDQPTVAHLSFCCEETLYTTFHRCFLPNLNTFSQMVVEKIFNWQITNKYCLWRPYQLYDLNEICKCCTGYPIHHSYKVTIQAHQKMSA